MIPQLPSRSGRRATGSTGNRKLKRIITVLMALVCTGAVLYLLWDQGAFLPGWIPWRSGEVCDGQPGCEILLRDRRVTVRRQEEILWESPKEVKVQQALWADVDNDGKEELVLLCWKKGRYGKSRPFWVERDEKKWSQHLFVYEYDQDVIRSKWMSSYLGMDVESVAVNGEKPPLSRLYLTDREGKVSCWRWDFWGFTKEEREVTFVAFGDNLIHEPIYRYGLNNGGSFDFLFENFEEILSESDIAVINQETPLTDDPSQYGGYPRFGTPVQVGEAVADAGFAVVTCATNHALDRGGEGATFTKKFFDSRGITCLGIQTQEERRYRPFEVVMRNGIRFGMLNYTYGTNGIAVPKENPYMVHLLENEDQIREDIAKAEKETDFVVVFVHWGTEGSGQIDEFQKKWTQVFLEAGVDALIGTHPHALQPFEMLEREDGSGMLVYYSLGNFVSAQNESVCVKGGMAKFTVSLTRQGYRVTEYDLHPLVITRGEKGRYETAVSKGRAAWKVICPGNSIRTNFSFIHCSNRQDG